MSALEQLCCPLDQLPLIRQERSLVCANGHAYDIAKTGYINLLPVQKKHSKDPGDSKEMVAARRDFLAQGYYDPIIAAIVTSVPETLKRLSELRLFDAGCGEGHYLRQIVAQLTPSHSMDAVGLDISKWAITDASKRAKTIDWIVGSNAHVPVAEGRFDWVMCAFGFPVFPEFSRILADQGWLLLVESGADHLIELRQILYPEIKPHRVTYTEGVEGFVLRHEVDQRFAFSLDNGEDIARLLAMTPHIHKASYQGKQAALALQKIDLTADVKLRWYQKQGKNHVE
ncbi:23S rRNA (guanine(745)-N(1))-methyltransferase [Marinomonas aquimarina]|uniref:23S rRNA (Guanine(745)-N(1))-methyltransferase n=1 Tax=Marinomonas aquimarina TaxID=295068 RepID=A0A1A8TBV3_9GAMM|nr:methyltransferase domain-containing protein [Marinomonas aquimarina]SBS30183.1 23S rRNA (guanine(745)-N(1))-methyltransferase [Marinomonas aquimarina]